MRIFFIFVIFILLTNCSQNKRTFWCGDHPCINKAERKAYFKRPNPKDYEPINTQYNCLIKNFNIAEKKLTMNIHEVGLIMGSQSDWPTMKETADILDKLKINFEKLKNDMNSNKML